MLQISILSPGLSAWHNFVVGCVCVCVFSQFRESILFNLLYVSGLMDYSDMCCFNFKYLRIFGRHLFRFSGCLDCYPLKR